MIPAAIQSCHAACHGNDVESHCALTHGPYCGVTNPELVKLPTSDQLAAVEAFRVKWSDKALLKRRGYRNWIEALQVAWYQGWDDREPGGGLLRSVRNDPRTGHEWLAKQPVKGPVTAWEVAS